MTHFIVVWRRHGHFVQIMDPGIGRRWVSCAQLLAEAGNRGPREGVLLHAA